jgi:hypothetical protein
MSRDFEQLVGSTRYWLRSTTKPRLSRNNLAGRFGKTRRDFVILTDPVQCVAGFELTSVIGGHCIFGALQVQTLTARGTAELTELAWDEDKMAVRSPMTGSNNIHLIEELSGLVLDRVHDQFAMPLQQILRNID